MAGDYCPLQHDPDDEGLLPCLLEDCAWYDPSARVCAVLAISGGIDMIREGRR